LNATDPSGLQTVPFQQLFVKTEAYRSVRKKTLILSDSVEF